VRYQYVIGLNNVCTTFMQDIIALHLINFRELLMPCCLYSGLFTADRQQSELLLTSFGKSLSFLNFSIKGI